MEFTHVRKAFLMLLDRLVALATVRQRQANNEIMNFAKLKK